MVVTREQMRAKMPKDREYTDEEIDEHMRVVRGLAELAFADWWEKKKQLKLAKAASKDVAQE